MLTSTGLPVAAAGLAPTEANAQFLHELAGKERRDCVWTGIQGPDANERLPLFSERERCGH